MHHIPHYPRRHPLATPLACPTPRPLLHSVLLSHRRPVSHWWPQPGGGGGGGDARPPLMASPDHDAHARPSSSYQLDAGRPQLHSPPPGLGRPIALLPTAWPRLTHCSTPHRLASADPLLPSAPQRDQPPRESRNERGGLPRRASRARHGLLTRCREGRTALAMAYSHALLEVTVVASRLGHRGRH